MGNLEYFTKYQQELLWLANTKAGKHLIGAKPTDKIVKLSPNSFHRLEAIEEDKVILTGFFRTYENVAKELLPILTKSQIAQLPLRDEAWVDLVDNTTINLDFDNGANRKFRVTLGGNRTFTFSNVLEGQVIMLRITNDETARTPVWFSGITWIGIEDDPDMADYVALSKTGVFIFVCTNDTESSETFDGYFLGAEE